MPFLVATAHRAAVAVAPVSASPDVLSGAVKGGTALWVTLAMLAGRPYTIFRPLSRPPSSART
eukprot:4657817-Pleurochrysis_carterae.AAC.1